MSITAAIVLFCSIWAVIFFMILPTGVVSQQEDGNIVPGTPASAPTDAQIPRKMLRTTKGKAIRECAIGIRTMEVRKLSGGSSSATMKPKPSVTALVPSGSRKIGSSIARHAPRPLARPPSDSPPTLGGREPRPLARSPARPLAPSPPRRRKLLARHAHWSH